MLSLASINFRRPPTDPPHSTQPNQSSDKRTGWQIGGGGGMLKRKMKYVASHQGRQVSKGAIQLERDEET